MIEERLTTDALPDALSRSKASRAQRTVPSRLVLHTLSHASSEIWRKSERSPTPALLTSTSSLPCAAPIAAISALTCVGVGDIDLVRGRRAVRRDDGVGHLFRRLAVHIRHDHHRALAREGLGDGAADAGPAPVTSAILSSSRRI